MGIDRTSLEAILVSLKYTTGGNVLTLGRQGIHINRDTFNHILARYDIKLSDAAHSEYCEQFFKELKFDSVESLDYSQYERASIIHDMNKPVPSELMNRFRYIYDGGTIEHIFNAPQVCENITNMLEVGGIFCSVTCNNNFSGHGIYQYSPEFFMSAFSEKYGMKIIALYLAELNTTINLWANVKSFNEQNNGRNDFRFYGISPVYIITIAQKVSNTRSSLITDSPQQYSYANIDWVK